VRECTPPDFRFDNETLVLGYTQNLEWTCSQLDYLLSSNYYHWTIVGEFTRELRG
jgi:hypothetical protein